jgi:hypothetical protein
MKLFSTGFLQVAFVSANVHFISTGNYTAMAFTGFSISYIWTLNVKRVAISDNIDRIIYSLGAMSGGLFGVMASKLI